MRDGYIADKPVGWWSVYETLDLRGGKAEYLVDECEDMIEIHYEDGMCIDIGKYAADSPADSVYCITVVPSDDINGWQNIIETVEVNHKKDLYDKIQETIYKYQTLGSAL